MPTFDYISAQNDAKELIEEFGVETVLGKIASDYDPVSEIDTAQTVLKSDGLIVALPGNSLTGITSFDNQFREELKKGKVRLFYMSAKDLSFAPDAGYVLTFENRVWDILGVTPFNPAGTPIFYAIGADLSRHSMSILDLPTGTPCEDGLNIVTNEW